MDSTQIIDLLEAKYRQYNDLSFIETDPVSIPHYFTNRGDIEISAFLAATLSWGQRPVIIKKARYLMSLMDDAPADFIKGFTQKDLLPFQNFCHRTFNGTDCTTFLMALQHILNTYHTLEDAFLPNKSIDNSNLNVPISLFRSRFFGIPHLARTEKHLSDPLSNAACKRMNMFLRWMVREDHAGVDFGIWKKMKMADLHLPLDVHSGRVARKLGLLIRRQDDWKAVLEVTNNLRKFCPQDPVKYDYALFGMGVFEKF